jgi:hypothetical protein
MSEQDDSHRSSVGAQDPPPTRLVSVIGIRAAGTMPPASAFGKLSG